MRLSLPGFALMGALMGGLAAAPARAEPVVVDRIVAVVGPRPLLLSELRARAAPLVAKLDPQPPLSPAARAKAERALVDEVLQHLIDAELVAQAAVRAGVEVTSAEIDAGLSRVAAQNRMSVREVLVLAEKQGFSEALYREEIARQIREVKMLRFRPIPAGEKVEGLDDRGRLEVLERVRRTWLAELRRATYVEIRL